MIDVKITLPNENQGVNFSNFVEINDDKFSNINFLINKNVPNADFWFVFEDLDKDIEHCRVPRKNVIYLNTETSFKKSHFFQNYMHSYISQFGTTYSCYPMDHNNLINAIPFLPWMIHANYDASPLDISKMNLLVFVKYLYELFNLINCKKPDVIHCFTIKPIISILFLNILF